MTLLELQKVLGDRITVTNSEELSDEQRKEENCKSEVIARLAKQMINNADIVLRTDKLIADGKITDKNNITKLVGGNSGKGK